MKPIHIILIGMVIVLIPNAALSLSAITVGGHIACFAESDLDDIIKFAVARDTASGQAYLDQKRCFVLKKGLQVTITDYGFSKSECTFKGTKFWTVTEAIKRQK